MGSPIQAGCAEQLAALVYNGAMLNFTQNVRKPTLHRRRCLQLASTAMLGGLTGTSLSFAEQPKTGFGKAKSVLTIFASGGQSQIDMWDPKPMAPEHIRGAFKPLQTRLPGVHFTEDMQGLASIADRFTLVRSMAHEDLDHGSATYLTLTGRYYPSLSTNPPPKPTDLPSLGAILNRLPLDTRFPYDSVYVNGPALIPINIAPGQFGGVLGKAYDPLMVGDPTGDQLAIPGLTYEAQLPEPRMRALVRLKQILDSKQHRLSEINNVQDNSRFYGQAVDMLSSPNVVSAFDLSKESERTKDTYGRYRSGQACLLGRRLVEAGVPYINVIFNHSNRGQDLAPDEIEEYGWDTHNDIFPALKKQLIPRFDKTVTALIKDLDERGLLETTLVVVMGEFGRAPLVAVEPNFPGNRAGRKHWASAYSIFMAGAGVVRGQVVGKTDRFGGEVVDQRYAPWDVAATMFHALGIEPHGHFTDALDRPYPVSVGKPITALY